MNIKEFNDKKQCIIDELNEINASQEPMQYGKYSWLFDNIQEFQPPTPPTCATCTHCYHEKLNCGDGIIADYYNCLHFDIDHNMLPYIDEPKKFGCIHHSDYEVKNENN